MCDLLSLSPLLSLSGCVSVKISLILFGFCAACHFVGGKAAAGGPAVNQKLKIIIKSLLLLLYHVPPPLPPISHSISICLCSSFIKFSCSSSRSSHKKLISFAGVANKKPKQFRLTVNCVILFSQWVDLSSSLSCLLPVLVVNALWAGNL